MSTSTFRTGAPTRDRDEVVSWRLDQLAAHGFDPPLAAAVAGDCRYDLHGLIELVGRGCPPELAAKILAPLVVEARPC